MQVQEIKKGDRVRLTLEFTAVSDVSVNISAGQPWASISLGEHEDPQVKHRADGLSHFMLEVPLTHDDVEVEIEPLSPVADSGEATA